MFFFFFNDTATTDIYTLSLHDALPILLASFYLSKWLRRPIQWGGPVSLSFEPTTSCNLRSEEHTSELQSRVDLVCRLLLEKKKKRTREVAVPGRSGRM